MKLTLPMCELIGAVVGDANLHDKRPYYVEFCLNPAEDREYVLTRLLPIVKQELDYSPTLFEREGGLRFRINNKKFVEWLKALDIPSGKGKCYEVVIPEAIIAGGWESVRACIRGIVDTDGCVFFDLRPSYISPYPRIVFHMSSHKLLLQLRELLQSRFKVSLSSRKESLWLNGKLMMQEFLRSIGFSNTRYLIKIRRHYPTYLELNRDPAT